MMAGHSRLGQSDNSDLPPAVTLEDVACPLECTPDDERIVVGRDRLHDLPGKFAVVKCRTCGLMRTNPRPTQETIGFYYPEDYRPFITTRVTGQPAPPSRLDRDGLWRGRVKKLLKYDAKALPPADCGRLLELGCASGSFLERMQQAGWEVEGIEASATAAQAAREAGYDVQNSTLEAAQDPEKLYDLIIGWMVLGHLHEPVDSLTTLRKWCDRNGWLVLSIPDAGSLEFTLFRDRWYALHLPCHLYHFSRNTLKKMLESTGWKVERTFWHRNPNNTLNSLGYLASDLEAHRVANYLYDITEGRRHRYVGVTIGVLLGLLRQSGRMTVWARPR